MLCRLTTETTPNVSGRPASGLATLTYNIGLWTKPGYMALFLAIITQHFLVGILVFLLLEKRAQIVHHF